MRMSIGMPATRACCLSGIIQAVKNEETIQTNDMKVDVFQSSTLDPTNQCVRKVMLSSLC